MYYNLNRIYEIHGEGYQQFSFLVKSSESSNNQFENYVLIQYADESFRHFVITYDYTTSEKDAYEFSSIRELEGDQLLSRSVGFCYNIPQLTPITVEVCTYNMCSGNIHNYGDTSCPCGETSNCQPPSRNCETTTQWVMTCPDGGNTGGNDGNDNSDNNTTGGGNGGNSNDNEIPVVPVEETPMDRILECMNSISVTGPNINMPQSLADSLNMSSECTIPLDNFLQDQGCNFVNKDFAIEAARACLNNEEVIYEDKIIKDDNFSNTKVECIYNKLMESSSNFRSAIQLFDGDFPVAHLRLSINNSLGDTTYGETQPPENYVIEIQFNDNRFSNLSDLGKAIVFAHEIIHAEIFRKMLSAAQRGDLNTATMTTQESVDYVESLREHFPQLYEYYWEKYRPTWNHNLMADHYRNSIAKIIEDFDDGRLSVETYKSLAWVGLGKIENNQTTTAWDNLTLTQQQAIESIIDQHFFNGPIDCN